MPRTKNRKTRLERIIPRRISGIFKRGDKKQSEWAGHAGSRKKTVRGFRGRKMRVAVKRILLSILKSWLLKAAFLLLCIAGLGIGIRYFLSSPKFDISAVDFNGTKQLSFDELNSRFNYLYGRNIFLVRSSKLQAEVLEASPFIESVKVEKDLPSVIIITIEEREPRYLWINFAGIYLVSTKGVVLEVVNDYSDLDLSSDELDLLKGYGDLSQINSGSNGEVAPNETTGTENQTLSTEEKWAAVDRQRAEILSRVNTFFDEKLKEIPDQYKAYQYIFSYDMKNFLVREEFSEEITRDTVLAAGIDFLGESVNKYTWESEYRLVLTLARKREIIFSTRRDFLDQIEKLRLLITDLKNEGHTFKVVDLSSDVIMYEVEQ